MSAAQLLDPSSPSKYTAESVLASQASHSFCNGYHQTCLSTELGMSRTACSVSCECIDHAMIQGLDTEHCSCPVLSTSDVPSV